MEPILLHLATRIREERLRAGISQEDFADVTGLHRTAVGLLERGKTIPRLDTLIIVSQGLGITTSDLLQGIRLKTNKEKNETDLARPYLRVRRRLL